MGKDISFCRFEESCSGIPDKIMTFSLFDDETSFEMQTNSRDFLVDGEAFGHNKGQYCYIPTFVYGLANPTEREENTWFAGSLVWHQYIVVLDNTPAD